MSESPPVFRDLDRSRAMSWSIVDTALTPMLVARTSTRVEAGRRGVTKLRCLANLIAPNPCASAPNSAVPLHKSPTTVCGDGVTGRSAAASLGAADGGGIAVIHGVLCETDPREYAEEELLPELRAAIS